ncbi:DUF6207 family protein [Streptomyces caniferus]|uniref:DUF6207 family protein n=1 Tax=Streptomyces caniferus TaxID=285557 RepID=UPI00371F5A6F
MAVIDITTADQASATEAAVALGGLWFSSGVSAPWHTPSGQAVVTARAYADLRRPLPTGLCP